MPAKKKKKAKKRRIDKRGSVHVSPKQNEALKKISKETGISIAFQVRTIIDRYLISRKRKEKQYRDDWINKKT